MRALRSLLSSNSRRKRMCPKPGRLSRMGSLRLWRGVCERGLLDYVGREVIYGVIHVVPIG